MANCSLPLPERAFQLFHRRLPTMEILVYGKQHDITHMYVSIKSMDTDLEFVKDITPTETFEESLREILFTAHRALFDIVDYEKAKTLEAGHHVH